MDPISVLCYVGAAIVICIFVLFLYAVYSGLFHRIKITTGKPPIGKATIAYKFGTGAYKNMGPTFCEIFGLTPENRLIGLYYDNPDHVKESEIRWAVGSIIAECSQTPNDSLVKLLESKGYQIFDLPETKSMVRTSFPFTTKLSNYISIWRVYDPIAAYIEKHQLKADPYVSIYEKDTIHYLEPLEKTREFYVPEARNKYNY